MRYDEIQSPVGPLLVAADDAGLRLIQLATWRALAAIPYGATISYAELARRVGKPAASRAVGAANGQNPLPIVVPCHRVIGKDGSLTGFGGGLPAKRALLELEGAACVAPQGQMRLV